ncbi:MAG: hypothetical protein IJD92_02025 [Bacilli bacterium]|nr:hypothetical protein [Bacilli bacterium]
MEKEFDNKKTKYFLIAIILLIFLGIILIIHFNNKSLVNGDEENKTTTTTTTVTTTTTTTTRKRTTVKRVNVEEYVYKSTVDSNNLVYDYKTSKEILNSDILISTKLELNEYLINNNIISLYDISLYDSNNVKKDVVNTSITVKIPIENIDDYNTLKVVFINDNNEITDEVIESNIDNNYLVFTTTHLSKFGIVGEKKIILDNVTLDVLVNDIKLEDFTNVLVSKTDLIDIKVNNIDYEYEIFYALKNSDIVNYELFDKNMFSKTEAPNKYTLLIKVVVKDIEKIFEVGVFDVYDIVFVYDKEEEIKEDIEIGTIYTEDETIYKNEDGSEYKYDNFEINNNIVIDNVEEVITENKVEITDENNDIKEETIENDTLSEEQEIVIDTNIEENSNTNLPDNENDNIASKTESNSENNIINENIVGSNNDINNDLENNTNEEENKEETNNDENLENSATITLNGNIYLVEKTDISNLEINGYLIIDTSEDIIFKNNEDKLDLSNIYSIIIKSKEFSINGTKYTYEFVDNKIIIKKYEEVVENEEKEEIQTDVTDTFDELFGNVEVNTNENNELVIDKKETEIIESTTEEIIEK